MNTPSISILVVDDTPENRHLFAHILRETGCEVVEAASGEEALRVSEAREYAMILMDVHMPGMDGFEAARRIRAFPCCAITPIVFVSAVYTSDSDRYKGYGEGAVDYLLSPVVPEILRAKARAFIEIFQRRKEAEEFALRMEQANRQLRAANEELESFSYAAAHDLRAPLRAIGGFAEILLEDYLPALDAPGRDHLRRIGGATGRMNELIDSLLELGKVTRSTMRQEPVDLSALAGDIAREIQGDSPRPVEWVIAPGQAIDGDPGLLRILLANLLGNAWKYTARRDAARIEFGREMKDGQPAFFVRDNGIGFDSAQAAGKLFKPFQRLHSAEEAPGSGIGLATVRRIVTKHGGRIWAESEKGDGATFWFTLGHE
ncbi:MAG: response regulator [Rhodocyclales bacterium]|nr:response regulator [Rhodocyclales bacterium]